MPVAPTRLERRQILPDSSSDDDSIDEDAMPGMGMGPLDNEDEQERLLSKRHGEAMEDNSRSNSSKKRASDQTDQEIADEYAAAGDKKKIKKPRLTLQPDKLVGSENGLIVIKQSFPSRMKPFLPSSKPKKNRVDAAALFSRKLVSAYLSYCEDLFPSLAPEDVLLKIETFGSKKQVKDYLQHLREDIRNAHVERLYGLEKGESLIQQLHDGLREQDEPAEAYLHEELEQPEEREDALDGPTSSTGPASQPEATSTADPEATTATEDVGHSSSQRIVEDEEDHMPTSRLISSTVGSKRRIEDSSDEEEATFDQMDDEEDDESPRIQNVKQAGERQREKEAASISEDSTTSGSKDPPSVKNNRRIDDSSDEEEANFNTQGNPNEDEIVPEPAETKKAESNIDVVEGEDVEASQLESEKPTNHGDLSSVRETDVGELETQPRHTPQDAEPPSESLAVDSDSDRQAQLTEGEGDEDTSDERPKPNDRRSRVGTEKVQNAPEKDDSMFAAGESISDATETGELDGLARGNQPALEGEVPKAAPKSSETSPDKNELPEHTEEINSAASKDAAISERKEESLANVAEQE